VDAGNIIYIVAVIIYFIYSALKKDKSKTIEPSSNDSESERNRPASFEDLLKEIRQSQQSREVDFDKTGQGEVLETSKNRKIFTEPMERRDVVEKREEQKRQETTSTVYDKYQGQMGEKMVPKRQKLDDQVSIDEPITRLGIPELEIEKSEAKTEHYYSKLLKDPQSVKDAVILGEILNRRSY
jgi:hypothetical protein